MRPEGNPGGGRAGLAAVLAGFALLAGWHAVRLPLLEGPDEQDNLHYVRFLAEEGRLTEPTIEVSEELELLGRGHMPPLWFLHLAPLFSILGGHEWHLTYSSNPAFIRSRGAHGSSGETLDEVLADPHSRLFFLHGPDEARPFEGAGLALRLLRFETIPWGLLALVAVWLAARRAFAGDGRAASWATALAAFTPQLHHLAGTITMDLMLAAWGGLCLAACAAWCDATEEQDRSVRHALVAGLFAGLACLTKLNGLVLLPALALAALVAWRDGRALVKPALAAFAAALLVAGPWYLWGWIESGHPLWTWKYQQISPFHNPVAAPLGLVSWTGVAQFGITLFLTWFADFGWTAVWFPWWVNLPVALLLGAGAFAVVGRIRGAGWREGRRVAAPLLFLSLAALGMLAAELFFNLRALQPQGRHLYPFLPALVVPVAAGLARLRILPAAALAHLALALLALPTLLADLRPAGWNEDPRWAVTDLGRAPDPDLTDPGRAAIAWVTEPGATLPADAAPTLRWEAREGALYDVVLAIDNPELHPRHWRRAGTVFRALRGRFDTSDGLALPASFWDAVESGQTLWVQVIELGPDGRARARSAVAGFVKG